ncbi:Thiamine pyrophosphate enzyme, N-terminal TPP binding domain [Sedimentitalea nanhaiensis]|uniref:Thiamine pyrophosphate enzyme, N-terminal TPP binding domain n=1 Tax=Sedimentitalea nanhaiensis TaxID=999627 RepID=A0A1I6YZQ6_9RHOB|nr:Thiamine pyrophosphate enzyme, N-terminal TPP binding domain [Sedimentitalea nanhaiensis]
MQMTAEQAVVKPRQMHGIERAFGITGSAFMPISDISPKTGITFWDCAHEGSGGTMADGYTRVSAPAQIDIPRFCRTQAIDIDLPEIVEFEPSAAGQETLDRAGRKTPIEAMVNQELGQPFRRDAMKRPVEVAAITPARMNPRQAG